MSEEQYIKITPAREMELIQAKKERDFLLEACKAARTSTESDAPLEIRLLDIRRILRDVIARAESEED